MRPLWIDPDESRFAALEGDLRVDVAIIGGGLSGIGAAHALREENASTVLLESRTLGSGASGRNAGFVLAGPAQPFDTAVATLGAEGGKAIWNLTVKNHRLMSGLATQYQIDCGYQRRGSMSLAASEEEYAALRATFGALVGAGVPVCLLAREDLPQPFDRMYFGGLYYGGNGEINAGAFVRGVGRFLRGAVSLFERTPVLSVSRRGEWRLQTPGGIVAAERVIVATNAYTSALIPHLPIAPRRGQVLATCPLPRTLVPCPMYANYGYQYWRQTGDGRLVVGGWRDLDPGQEVGTEERLHRGIQLALEAFCSRVLAAPPVVEYRWAGIMGFTPDMLPLVGAVPLADGLYVAAGYSGHGVAMAFICGALAAGMAVNRPADVPPAFDPSRLVEASSTWPDFTSAPAAPTAALGVEQADENPARGRDAHERDY